MAAKDIHLIDVLARPLQPARLNAPTLIVYSVLSSLSLSRTSYSHLLPSVAGGTRTNRLKWPRGLYSCLRLEHILPF